MRVSRTLGLFAVALCLTTTAAADAPLEVVKAFEDTGEPFGSPVFGADGALYGTFKSGGARARGGIYRIQPDGTDFSILHSATPEEGLISPLGLVPDGGGGFFGISNPSAPGSLFHIAGDGTGYTVVHSFATPLAAPAAPILVGGDGFLYGVTGISLQRSSVFRVKPDGSGFAILHVLQGLEGFMSLGPLIAGNDGFLYGTTNDGGAENRGSVFRVARDGTSFATVLALTASQGSGLRGPLVLGAGGLLYGLAVGGPPGSLGAVFRVATNGTGFSLLHSFVDPGHPRGLQLASDGRLYGITAGPAGLFSLATDGSGFAFQPLEGWTDDATTLVEGPDGALYGTFPSFGRRFEGRLYRIEKDGSNYVPLHDFGSPEGYSLARGVLAQDAAGNLYGTALSEGPEIEGTVFKIASDGSHTTLHGFDYPDGYPPVGVVLGSDGLLYGVAQAGGTWNYGTAFRLGTDGQGFLPIFTFDDFSQSTGNTPLGNMVEGPDGRLYGTTTRGGGNGGVGGGTVFRIERDGTDFTVLYRYQREFTDSSWEATGRLLFGHDGRLYGTAQFGPADGRGFVFAMHMDGTGFTVLKAFEEGPGGAYPNAGLVQAPDGTLYGVNQFGGLDDNGTVFSLRPDGSDFRVLHAFDGEDGATPRGDLLFAGNGYLYGTTAKGGAHGLGTVFCLRIATGFHRTLHEFDGETGVQPWGGLTLTPGGVAWGTTVSGGPLGGGVVFRLPLDLEPRPNLSISDVTAPEGARSRAFTFDVTLSPASPDTVSVDYVTEPGTASTKEVVATSGTLTFAPNETHKSLTVMVRGDLTQESDETFFVRLRHPVEADIATPRGRGTMLDDDAGPSSLVVRSTDASEDEGNSGLHNARFVLTLSERPTRPITIAYKTVAGTAKAGEDFNAVAGSVVFQRGQTRRFVDVPIRGDTRVEPAERFTLSLSTKDGVTLAHPVATGTIFNDDAPPGLSRAAKRR